MTFYFFSHATILADIITFFQNSWPPPLFSKSLELVATRLTPQFFKGVYSFFGSLGMIVPKWGSFEMYVPKKGGLF